MGKGWRYHRWTIRLARGRGGGIIGGPLDWCGGIISGPLDWCGEGVEVS